MNLYFIGICGTAMGNVALLMQELGHTVSGSDVAAYPPMSTLLKQSNITLYEGFSESRLQTLSIDCVIIGNAISRGNEELEWLLAENKIPYISLPELIKKELLKHRETIVVTGTHGKTTTTTIAAFILQELGANPGYLIGGVPKNLPTGSHLGELSSPFVIEGDEYDSAFFDKRSKFIHYTPQILVINNLEFDHADIFRDLQDVQRSFSHLLRIVPPGGVVLINGDDENIQPLLPIHWARVVTVGVGSHNDLQLTNFKEDISGSQFDLVWRGVFWGHVNWSLSGLYNARNAAMASLAVVFALYPDRPSALNLSCLSSFQGVKRRQEVLYRDSSYIVLEDFAHHPTALQATLEGLRERFPDYEIVVCLEPRSNTMCRQFHQGTLAQSLKKAHYVFLGPIYRENLYDKHERLDTLQIAHILNTTGVSTRAFSSYEALFEALSALPNPSPEAPRLVVFFTNGSFGGYIETWLVALEEARIPLDMAP